MASLDDYPHWGPVLLVIAGVVLTGVIALEAIVRVYTGTPFQAAFLMGATMNLPIYVGLIVGSVRLHQSSIPERYYPQVVRWSFAGAGAFALLVGTFVPTMYGAWIYQLAAIRWAVSVGIGAGFLAGVSTVYISHQRVAAERAAIRAEEATRREELLEYLNALLRHEVLNATNVIHGRATFLDDQVGDDGDVRTHLATIKGQAEEMSTVVQDVRTLIQANKDFTEYRHLHVGDVIERELRKVTDRYDDVTFDVALPDEATVSGNNLLPRVFQNLFRNAVEHAETTPVRIAVTGEIDGDEIHIRISDNGPGIPEAYRENLFMPSVNKLADENRLGTVIVGRLVEQHGGRIDVAETGPEGTKIVVTLPLASADRTSGGTEDMATGMLDSNRVVST